MKIKLNYPIKVVDGNNLYDSDGTGFGSHRGMDVEGELIAMVFGGSDMTEKQTEEFTRLIARLLNEHHKRQKSEVPK